MHLWCLEHPALHFLLYRTSECMTVNLKTVFVQPNMNPKNAQSRQVYLNLLTTTAMMRMTKIVMMAIVITRFVAILRAIPRNVLTLLST